MITKAEAPLTDQERAEREAALRGVQRRLAEESFLDFLRYVKVLEPPPGRGVVPFQMWDHCKEIATILPDTRRLIWGKSRQIGATTILAAYSLWVCYKDNAKVLLFSQGEYEAGEFLGKCSFIYGHLPEHLKEASTKDVTSSMQFANGASIQAFPSTKKAGRGQTGSLVIMDECDFHEFFRSNFVALGPAVSAVLGGQMILASTANVETMPSNSDPKGSYYKELLTGAPKNGFRRIFYGWESVPSRDKAWYDEQEEMAPDRASFEKEHPANLAEMLAPAQHLRSFDVNVLVAMKEFVQKPVEVKGRLGIINIYQHRSGTGLYMAGTDVAHGGGNDYSVTVVLDISQRPAFIVADIMANTVEPEEFALESIDMLAEYGNPLWGIEDNGRGQTVIKTAEDNIHFPTGQIFRGDRAGSGKHEGWHTEERHTRWVLWGDLKVAVKTRQLLVPNGAGLEQFFNVARNPKNDHRDEAMGGGNDDYPVAVGIAWQMRKHVYTWASGGEVATLGRRF